MAPVGSEARAPRSLTLPEGDLHVAGLGTEPSAAHLAPVGNQARRPGGSLTLQRPAPLVTATVTPSRAQLSLLGEHMVLLRDARCLEGGSPPDSCWETDGHRAASEDFSDWVAPGLIVCRGITWSRYPDLR